MSLHVGTSGWAYREWRPAFYPEGLPQDGFLAHYASRLTACEINATHYRLQTADAVANWVAQTPESFRFATKAHRRRTHGRVLPPHGGGEAFLAMHANSGEVPHLVIVAPILPGLGAVTIWIDAVPALARVVNSWPMASTTARTQIVMQVQMLS